MSHGNIRLNLALLGLNALLVSCASNYQAPVIDQGEEFIRSTPLIVESGNPNSSFPLKDREKKSPIMAMPENQTHRVRRGDNLISIAFEYDLDFRALASANGLIPPYTIFIDQEINLDIDRIMDDQTERNRKLGVEASNNSVAKAQGVLSRSGGLIRETIDSGSEPKWQWPLRGSTLQKFQANQNKGLDISGQVGDPVFAASDGDVVFSGRSLQGIGNLVIIRHSDKFLSAYAYNSKMLVNEGSRVNAGDKIAEVGLNSNGISMLHFEIRVNGKPADPESLLPNK
ncbi:MAG: peptidoglycan DD-metalloendopeptidase family protein [Gammaproteobacteria bacterium]|nr:peptidoglycan DD-metalloendopeptidase family protein [Gammaproteobacteria bacterium]